jgi:hypothetical protein
VKLLLRSLLLLLVSNALAAGAWSDFSRTDHFYEGAVSHHTLFLATDGGVRLINSDGSSSVSTSEDGLEASNIYGVVHAASGDIFTISDKGIIAAYLGNGKFAVMNRSYASAGVELVQGLAQSADSILVLCFKDKIAFFDYAERKSLISLSRIADASLKAKSPSAMLIQGDSLFVALGSSVYFREMNWKALAQDVLLADPESWSFVGSFDSGDTAKTEIQHLSLVKGKLSVSFEETLSPVVALGDTLSAKKFPALWKGDSSKVRQVVNADGLAYLIGQDSVWLYDGAESSNVSEWSYFPIQNPYVVTPYVNGDGGVTVYSTYGQFGWSDGESWTFQEPESPIAFYGGTEAYTRLLKNLVTLRDAKTLVGIWGYGFRLYAANGLHLEAEVTADLHSCVEEYLQDYIVPAGIAPSPDSLGWLVSYWGASAYGIAYIDEAGNVSCAGQVGSGKYAGPLVSAWSNDSTEWILYSAAGTTEGTEGQGVLDVFTITPISQTGGELKIASKMSIPTPDHKMIVDMDFDKDSRLWAITATAFAYWESGMDSVQAPHKTSSYEHASLSSIEVDPNNRLWIGTIGSGVYMIQKTATSPDTMKATKFVSRNGLLNDIVYDVAIDSKKGVAWFVHKNGMSAYYRTDLRETGAYMTSDGPEIKVYPNPFRLNLNQSVTFENVSEDAVISIYNAGAHLVRSFAGDELDGGRVVWDGKDRRGVLVAPGVYHYLIKKGSKKKQGKLIILH